MAGSIVVTATDAGNANTLYSVSWTSDASGNVNGTTMGVRPGRIQQIKFVPNGGGTAPTANYGVTLLDADGFDVLAGAGASLSASVATVFVPRFPNLATATAFGPIYLQTSTVLTPTITAAGNAKGGRFDLIIGPG